MPSHSRNNFLCVKGCVYFPQYSSIKEGCPCQGPINYSGILLTKCLLNVCSHRQLNLQANPLQKGSKTTSRYELTYLSEIFFQRVGRFQRTESSNNDNCLFIVYSSHTSAEVDVIKLFLEEFWKI